MALAASQSYLTVGEGLPRLVVDGLIVGMLQGLALRGLVRFPYWVVLSISALGLAIIAGVGTVVAAGSLIAPPGRADNDFYVVLSYGLGAVAAGLVGGFIQSVALPSNRRILPWLLASACGAPFLFPALLFSWFPSGAATAPLPAWAIGLLGGLVYGAISGIGLVRSLRPITFIA
ncbi:MAG: hypothetical protein M3O99_01820 [Chloroflexota bacterium]|nr:hypothetical protein [Chloroflexota bacterium]